MMQRTATSLGMTTLELEQVYREEGLTDDANRSVWKDIKTMLRKEKVLKRSGKGFFERLVK